MFYRRRRDLFCAAASKYLQGLAEWQVPSAGMFLWLTLRLPTGEDSVSLMQREALSNGILAIPGSSFRTSDKATCEIRVSFSLIAEEQMEEACKRLARLVLRANSFVAGDVDPWSGASTITTVMSENGAFAAQAG